MRIEQLKESQQHTLETLRKRSVLKVYIPIVGAKEGLKAVGSGLSASGSHTSQGVIKPAFPVSVDPAFAFHAGDIVISVITNPEHLRPPKQYRNETAVAKAEKMYPDSHYPLLSYSLIDSKNKTALLDGIIPSSHIKEIFITGFDTAGNKTKRGIEPLKVSQDQLYRWYVNSYMRNIKTGGHERNPPKHASPFYTLGDNTLEDRGNK